MKTFNEITVNYRQALIEQFLSECAGNLECAVSNACKTVLLELGLRNNGQRIRVQKGRYLGQEFPISWINWSEGEVYVDVKGVHRFFSGWLGGFQVVNPQYSGPIDPQAALNKPRGPESTPIEREPARNLLASDIFKF